MFLKDFELSPNWYYSSIHKKNFIINWVLGCFTSLFEVEQGILDLNNNFEKKVNSSSGISYSQDKTFKNEN
jgi:hypothetical protein